MKTKYTVVAGTMTLMIAITLILAGGSYASEKSYKTPKFSEEKIAEIKAAKNKITEAVKNNDYDTWKSTIESMPYGKKTEGKLTKETFDKMVSTKKLHTDIMEAVEKGDYSIWKTLVAKTKRAEVMLKAIDSEADFKNLIEAHKLIKDGKDKIKKGQDIMNDLGIKKPAKGKQHLKKGMKHNRMKQGFKMMQK